MARPRKHGPRITTAIRVPEELHAELTAIAEERDVSINQIMVKATEYYLAHVLQPLPDELVLASANGLERAEPA